MLASGLEEKSARNRGYEGGGELCKRDIPSPVP
jgi:hypothetical protein